MVPCRKRQKPLYLISGTLLPVLPTLHRGLKCVLHPAFKVLLMIQLAERLPPTGDA